MALKSTNHLWNLPNTLLITEATSTYNEKNANNISINCSRPIILYKETSCVQGASLKPNKKFSRSKTSNSFNTSGTRLRRRVVYESRSNAELGVVHATLIQISRTHTNERSCTIFIKTNSHKRPASAELLPHRRISYGNELSRVCWCEWMRGRVWRNFTFRFGNVARRASPFVDIWTVGVATLLPPVD